MTQQISAQLLKGGLTVDASGNVTAIGRFSGPTQRIGTIKAQDGTTAITIADSTGVVTVTSPVINTGISGTAILDEDAMGSDSATKLATQQSIKAYVDGKTHLSLIDEDFSSPLYSYNVSKMPAVCDLIFIFRFILT